LLEFINEIKEQRAKDQAHIQIKEELSRLPYAEKIKFLANLVEDTEMNYSMSFDRVFDMEDYGGFFSKISTSENMKFGSSWKSWPLFEEEQKFKLEDGLTRRVITFD